MNTDVQDDIEVRLTEQLHSAENRLIATLERIERDLKQLNTKVDNKFAAQDKLLREQLYRARR